MAESLYPVFLKLSGRRVAVVGAGTVATRKARTLHACGARVRVIAPDATASLRGLAERGEVEWVPRAFAQGDLDGCVLVVASTPDDAVNRAVQAEAHRLGILVNVVDVPELCDFYVPSVVRRGPVAVAVSTSGAAPAASRRLAREIDAMLPAGLGTWVDLLAEAREEVRRLLPGDPAARMALNARLVDCGARELVEMGEIEDARALLRRVAAQAAAAAVDGER